MSLELTVHPEELRKQFFELRTRGDIARMLDVSEDRLIYHLYIVPPHGRYEAFKIQKKSGGMDERAGWNSALFRIPVIDLIERFLIERSLHF